MAKRNYHKYNSQWTWMRAVTCRPNHPSYYKYGAKGIECFWERGEYFEFEAWIEKHLGPRPADHHLGRKNKLGHFEPKNLFWETSKHRSRNMPQINTMLTYKRKTQPLAVWADELGVPAYTIRSRLKHGHTMAQIVKEFS